MDASLASRLPRLTVLTLGPALTIVILAQAAADMGISGLSMLAIFAWSPLPIAIPGLLLQQERDQALSNYTGVAGSAVRGALLLPHLLVRPGVRLETWVSLISWFAVCLVAWPQASGMLTGSGF